MRIFEQIEVRWLLGSSVARILHSVAAQQYFYKAGLKELFLRKTTTRPFDGCFWLPERRQQKKKKNRRGEARFPEKEAQGRYCVPKPGSQAGHILLDLNYRVEQKSTAV